MMKIFSFLILFLIGFSSYAQLDSVQHLNVVNINSIVLKKHSKGYKILKLSDSLIVNNTESFSSLLRYNTPIYIKEYGSGGTSTASFRGTSASNTAVVWNGININSINNGQTGFNSLNVSLFDNIDIRSGGGSIEFGSGAVGGTIHLNNDLHFGKYLKNELVASIGSFDTYHNLYKFSFGSKKTAVKFGFSYNESENDYKWLGYDLKNENGAYHNTDFSFNIAQKLSNFTKISFHSSKYTGSREFSGELPNPSAANEKYKDLSFQNLIDVNYNKNATSQRLKLAYLTQEYQYFANKNASSYSYGKSKRYLINYDFSYKITSNSSIESFTEYESTFGETDQMLEKNRRQFSQSFIFNQQVNTLGSFNAKLRKDFNSDYTMPVVFALGAELNTTKNTFVRVNGSRNYRVPSYNDLYWPALGNEDLIPESSYQAEIGVGYKTKNLQVDAGGFFIDTKDKIVWTPGGDPDRPGVWVPINFDKVLNKGLELTVIYKINLNKHYFNLNANYSYTISKDKITKELLPYIPKHLFNSNLGYSFKKINIFYQQLYTGKVFTTTDNSENYTVPAFSIGNLGGSYSLLKTTNSTLDLGLKINNLFNKAYQVLPGRPMPNRNINFNINYKF
ncbi:TonB-dependent receptor plug domain-containing protein [Lutibacter sp.]|uniref:TonB-dependent receptor plug domain-containing protein n=1 Tax=Lutibacter sp. TaxID=1925666 RepID=UPI003564FC19